MRKTFAVFLMLPVLAAPVRAAVEYVSIPREGGFVLRGTLYSAPGPGAAVLLLHQCNRDRSGYETLAGALMRSGIHVLAIDFRGFGESTNEKFRDFGAQREELWPMFEDDVDAAISYLLNQNAVDRKRLGILGASCGGTQAVLAAERWKKEVKTVVLLSSSLPWMKDVERKDFAQRSSIPILCVAAEGDRTTFERSSMVFAQSKNGHTEMISYKGELHGTPLFQHDPSLADRIVHWFETHLGE